MVSILDGCPGGVSEWVSGRRLWSVHPDRRSCMVQENRISGRW